MNFDDDTIQIAGLDKLLKALKAKPPVAKIGILGSHASRSNGNGLTNADIGAAHEYGAPARGLPMRSFLRVPLTEMLPKEVEGSNALSDAEMKEVIKTGSVVPWLTKIAIMGENIVRGAFDSGGYGRWAPWKNPNYMNQTGQILLDTQQLRDSITSEVKA